MMPNEQHKVNLRSKETAVKTVLEQRLGTPLPLRWLLPSTRPSSRQSRSHPDLTAALWGTRKMAAREHLILPSCPLLSLKLQERGIKRTPGEY